MAEPPGRPGPSADRRTYGLTVLVGLAGGLAVTVAVTRPWVRGSAEVAGLPTIEAQVSGATVSPLAGALGVVLLASFGAVIATRGVVRRGLGVLVVLASLVVLVSALAPPDAESALVEALNEKGYAGGGHTSSATWWRWLALAGAVGTLLAGAATAVSGHRWPVMGSRYDAPAASRTGRQPVAPSAPAQGRPIPHEGDLWRAIDEGRDPTRDE